MSKLIRFDEDHFGYLVDQEITDDEADYVYRMFVGEYDGKHLIIMQADEFIDLTGQYEIIPIAEAVPA